MKLKLIPTMTLSDSTMLEVIDANTLRYNTEDYFFEPGMVYYDPKHPILSASRNDAGDLFICVHVMYTDASKDLWQTPDTKGLVRGDYYEDHGVGVVLAPPLPVEPTLEEAPQ